MQNLTASSLHPLLEEEDSTIKEEVKALKAKDKFLAVAKTISSSIYSSNQLVEVSK